MLFGLIIHGRSVPAATLPSSCVFVCSTSATVCYCFADCGLSDTVNCEAMGTRRGLWVHAHLGFEQRLKFCGKSRPRIWKSDTKFNTFLHHCTPAIMQYFLISSAKTRMFYPVYAGLPVSKITQKVVDEFWLFLQWCGVWLSYKFPVIFARTNRFKNSFICYGLVNYQWHWLVFYCVIVYCMYVHVL